MNAVNFTSVPVLVKLKGMCGSTSIFYQCYEYQIRWNNYRLSLSGFFRLRQTLYTVLATANAQAMAIVPAMAVAQQAVANP